MSRIFTFDTTHHALWAEQIAMDRAIGAQVIPAPADANAKCDLALEVLDEEADLLATALIDAAVPFRPYIRSGAAG